MLQVSRMRFGLAGVLWLFLILPGSLADAQFVQYTSPGDFQGPAESREQTFERAMKNARWRFGRLLADPWLALRNVGYQDNLTEPSVSGDSEAERVSDVTASVGAGLNTYMAIGSDFIWGTFVLPEYVWWQEFTERRRLNGRYGTGLFGNLGRIGLEATVSRFEQPEIFSIEVDEPFNQRSDQAVLDFTVDLGKGLLFFGRADETRFRSLEDAAPFEVLGRLDRDETIYRAGLGFLSTRGLRIGVGIEESETAFEPSAVERSNTGSAIVLDLQYDGPLFKLAAELADRSFEPETTDSEFVPFDGETGSLNLSFRTSGPVWLEFFGRRHLSYSLQETVSYIENDSVGLGLSSALGSRTRMRVFFEQGDSSFLALDAASMDRVDDRASLGASLSVTLGRLSFSLNAARTDYESNFPENDRQVTRLSTSLALGGGQRRSSPWG